VVVIAASAVLGHQLGSPHDRPFVAAAKQLIVSDPYAAGGHWYKGNLHVASLRGTGNDLPSAVGAWYAAHGYAFLGISDVNTYTWTQEYGLFRALTGLPTVDASYAFGDVLAVGMDHWQPARTLQGAIDWIAADGGLPLLVDPLRNASSLRSLHGLYGLEVYDAGRAHATPGQDPSALWDQLLSSGNRVFALAGDGAAGLSDPAIGQAWTDVLAPAPDLDSLLSSLRRGAFIASSGASFASLRVAGTTIVAEAGPGSSLRFIGRGGRLLKSVGVASGSYRVSGDEGYVRVEAIRDDGSRAWSQPFYLSWR
jgi:hypothetical protein